MNLARVVFAFSALSLAASCDSCETTVIERVSPVIAIGDPFVADFSICQAGVDGADTNRFRDCSFDFGEVNVGAARVFSFTVKNPSQVTLLVNGVAFEPGADPAFAFDGVLPTSVVAGINGEVVSVKFAPQVEGTVNATVRIKSDAENLNPDEDVLINLSATGAARCQPDIEILPAQCDFGDVGVGATGFCDITINNLCTSSCDLLISDVGFSATTDRTVFGVQSPVPVPFAIGCGTGRTLRLFAKPTAAQTFNGALTIDSFDPDEEKIEVPLVVRGAEAPTCVARVSRINNVPNNSVSPEIEPLDDVELSASESSAAIAGGVIREWRWEILDQPTESSARLSTPTAETTRFNFSSAAGTVSGLDVAGTFLVGLIVKDDSNLESTQCTIALNAVPQGGLHVQMTWDQGGGDLDLHLAQNGTSWCSAADCHYGRTTTTWGARLEIDDLCGFGPENINMENIADGSYTVAVDFFGRGGGGGCSPTTSTTVTVRVFLAGQLQFEAPHLIRQGEQWQPVRIERRNGVSTVVELDDSSPQNGSCFGD